MEEKNLTRFFEQYIQQQSVFANRRALQTDFQPETIVHRDDQITAVAKVLAPLLRGERPNNLFIYGYPGTGKTLVAQFCARQLQQLAESRSLPFFVTYINCKLRRTADTEYRLVAQLAASLGRNVPATGLPTDEVYQIFYKELEQRKCAMLIILDEIDALVERTDDQLLYNLVRINEQLQHSKITLVGVSNNTTFKDDLDPRVRSSLSEEEVVFPRYNALQLIEILQSRASVAFTPNALEDGVLQKCAAIAAQEHGDARRALTLLRTAGELCERDNGTFIKIQHIDAADAAIEHESIVELVRGQPKQHNAVLYALFHCSAQRKQAVFTGEIYERYQQVCNTINLRPLTQRRISDILQEFDMVGIIQSKVISKGRYGRSREIETTLAPKTLSMVHSIISDALSLPQ